MVFLVMAIILLAILLVAIYLQQRKIARIDRATWELPKRLDDKINQAELRLYRQIEALNALNTLIHPAMPLPPLRDWAGSPDFLLELARRIVLKRPAVIVECGSGASTVVAARCCQLNGSGHVYSLEHGPGFADATRESVHEQGLGDWATVIHAPVETVSLFGVDYPWYALRDLPDLSIDLLVVDGPPVTLGPVARYPAGPMLFPRLSANAAVLVDDADRAGEQQIAQRWQEEFPALKMRRVAAEKGLVILEQTSLVLIKG